MSCSRPLPFRSILGASGLKQGARCRPRTIAPRPFTTGPTPRALGPHSLRVEVRRPASTRRSPHESSEESPHRVCVHGQVHHGTPEPKELPTDVLPLSMPGGGGGPDGWRGKGTPCGPKHPTSCRRDQVITIQTTCGFQLWLINSCLHRTFQGNNCNYLMLTFVLTSPTLTPDLSSPRKAPHVDQSGPQTFPTKHAASGEMAEFDVNVCHFSCASQTVVSPQVWASRHSAQ